MTLIQVGQMSVRLWLFEFSGQYNARYAYPLKMLHMGPTVASNKLTLKNGN